MVTGRRMASATTLTNGRRFIVGPILRDLLALRWDGECSVVATAFYSSRALQSLTVSSDRLQVLCRLDRDDPREWAHGMIAPDTLLERLRSFEDNGTEVELRVHRSAHAKVYWSERGVMVGSANLTLQGFGGAWEMLHVSNAPEDVGNARASLKMYARTLETFSLDDLAAYVLKYNSFVRHYARRHSSKRHRDRVSTPMERPPRLGDYEGFLKWLSRQAGGGASEILDRARGKSNLSGHIHRNFFGLRQFFIAYPERFGYFKDADASTYKLSKDASAEQDIADYVSRHAADENEFKLDAWKTYLPKECGGRAAKHGGTIGNLNRMLPLVARFLDENAT